MGTRRRPLTVIRAPTARQVLSEKQLAALGEVVAESTYLELLVESMICTLSGLNREKAAIFLNRAMMQAKLDILGDLAPLKIKSKRRRTQFKVLISALKANNQDRITAVHGVWEPSGRQLRYPMVIPTGEAEATHPRGSKMSARTLARLAQRISTGYCDLLDFYNQTLLAPAVRRRLSRGAAKARK